MRNNDILKANDYHQGLVDEAANVVPYDEQQNPALFNQPPQNAPYSNQEYQQQINLLEKFRRTLIGMSVSLPEIWKVGLRIEQAQNLNYAGIETDMRLKEYYAKKQMDLAYEKEKAKIQAQGASSVSLLDDGSNGHSSNNFSNTDMIVKRFIDHYQIVQNRRSFGRKTSEIYIRDFDMVRHVAIEEGTLNIWFYDYIMECLPVNQDLPQATLQRLNQRLRSSIPTIKSSGLREVKDYELVFQNGVLNLSNWHFSCLEDEKIFNKFSMTCQYEVMEETPAFDALLEDMFDNEPCKIKLAWEVIGALLSTVSTLKKIFSLQGVANGGKTRLAEIIYRLLDDEDGVITVNDLSEVTSDYIDKNAQNARLLYVQDAADKKITAKQASALKGYAGGSHIGSASSMKILICTNHELYEGDNKFLGTPLRNRMLVLPFSKKMDNTNPLVTSFEDVYLQQEKAGIIYKSLRAFSHVLSNNKNFSFEFPINEVVEAVSCDDNMSSLGSNVNFSMLFEILPEINTEMTGERIMILVNARFPKAIHNVASLGRMLKNHFGEDLISDRVTLADTKKQVTVYNLRTRTFEEIIGH